MTVIEFRRLSMNEADEVVAALWSCYEEHAVPSLPMTFTFHDKARVSMRLQIDDPALADIVITCLSNWSIAQRSREYVPIATRRIHITDVGGVRPSAVDPTTSTVG